MVDWMKELEQPPPKPQTEILEDYADEIWETLSDLTPPEALEVLDRVRKGLRRELREVERGG